MSYPRRTWTGSGSRSPRERPSRGGSGTLSTLSSGSGTLSGAVGTVGAVPVTLGTAKGLEKALGYS
jgi:hypothetical protein